ncbi:MAG: hypothetical protein KDH92_04215 [Chloroflexi bacterium]|nr:hypothetical protein [Chloroflexota bacterium]
MMPSMSGPAAADAPAARPLSIAPATLAEALGQLVGRHGEAERARIARGLAQVAARWTQADGDAAAFLSFCLDAYVAEPEARRQLLERLETTLDLISGHLLEIRRGLRRWSDLVVERAPAIDDLAATFDPAPDLDEQWYAQKLGFVALLNFARPSLAEMLAEGPAWDDADWAAARVAQHFGPRVPAEVGQRARRLQHRAGSFVDGFHVPVGSMVDAAGKRWFEPGRKLVAHWLIREQIKAGYAEPGGLALQRALGWVMRRHIDGSIPRAVMDGRSDAAWDPESNRLAGQAPAEADTVGLERYERWLDVFAAARAYDAHHPEHPTAIARTFELEREIPEAEVERLLVELLESPVRAELAGRVAARLGRPLEAHDIYYEDLLPKPAAAELNARLAGFYPDAASLERKLPELLRHLGWSDEDAEFFGRRVKVEIARGPGHAMPAGRPEMPVWLRTNSLDGELGWDGFDIAMHELGHNLEQLCSMHRVSRPALRGVPNNACTEAFAFLYQAQAPRAIGLDQSREGLDPFDAGAISALLAACQIAGPGLLELQAWRWLYANPEADAAGLRQTVLRLAGELWDRYYARDYGPDRYHLLAAYQHMVAYPLYLPDYALGHIVSHQIASRLRDRDLAAETLRICAIGRVTPDLWLRRAVGEGLSTAPLVRDAELALGRLRG